MIYVYKARRLLEVRRNGTVLLSCPVSLGFSPVGHKTREGDGRTPEGSYRICTVNHHSRFSIALGISYPSAADALSALRKKQIRPHTLCLIAVCELLRMRPPWRTPLGGYIMLHGESPEQKTGDWTAGCIAVSDADILKISRLCRKGERIIIEP